MSVSSVQVARSRFTQRFDFDLVDRDEFRRLLCLAGADSELLIDDEAHLYGLRDPDSERLKVVREETLFLFARRVPLQAGGSQAASERFQWPTIMCSWTANRIRLPPTAFPNAGCADKWESERHAAAGSKTYAVRSCRRWRIRTFR